MVVQTYPIFEKRAEGKLGQGVHYRVSKRTTTHAVFFTLTPGNVTETSYFLGFIRVVAGNCTLAPALAPNK